MFKKVIFTVLSCFSIFLLASCSSDNATVESVLQHAFPEVIESISFLSQTSIDIDTLDDTAQKSNTAIRSDLNIDQTPDLCHLSGTYNKVSNDNMESEKIEMYSDYRINLSFIYDIPSSSWIYDKSPFSLSTLNSLKELFSGKLEDAELDDSKEDVYVISGTTNVKNIGKIFVPDIDNLISTVNFPVNVSITVSKETKRLKSIKFVMPEKIENETFTLNSFSASFQVNSYDKVSVVIPSEIRESAVSKDDSVQVVENRIEVIEEEKQAIENKIAEEEQKKVEREKERLNPEQTNENINDSSTIKRSDRSVADAEFKIGRYSIQKLISFAKDLSLEIDTEDKQAVFDYFNGMVQNFRSLHPEYTSASDDKIVDALVALEKGEIAEDELSSFLQVDVASIENIDSNLTATGRTKKEDRVSETPVDENNTDIPTDYELNPDGTYVEPSTPSYSTQNSVNISLSGRTMYFPETVGNLLNEGFQIVDYGDFDYIGDGSTTTLWFGDYNGNEFFANVVRNGSDIYSARIQTLTFDDYYYFSSVSVNGLSIGMTMDDTINSVGYPDETYYNNSDPNIDYYDYYTSDSRFIVGAEYFYGTMYGITIYRN